LRCGSTKESGQVCHSGVGKSEYYYFTHLHIVTITVTITYKNHYTTNYSKYQQYLFDRIKGYKDDFISGIGYRKITKILNSEGLKTPRNKTFKQNHVHSIYKKGKIREERLNSEIEVTREMDVQTFTSDEVDIYLDWVKSRECELFII